MYGIKNVFAFSNQKNNFGAQNERKKNGKEINFFDVSYH